MFKGSIQSLNKTTNSSTNLKESNEEISSLNTTIQKPLINNFSVSEGFDGVAVNILKCTNSIFPIQNDLFEGGFKVFLRDSPNCSYKFNNDKGVLWEIQIQGKFTRKPKGPIYLALQIPQREEFKVTARTKIIIKASLQLMKTMGHKDIHISFGGGGGDDIPHLSAPAFHSFDRVVITKEGEIPPTLGQHLPRQPSDVQRRKNFFKMNHIIDTNCIYTFSVKNRRFNPLSWNVVGVPIIRSFSVSKFANSVRLALYEILEENNLPVKDTGGNVTVLARQKHSKTKTFMWICMGRKFKV